jgi:hypothetical protein
MGSRTEGSLDAIDWRLLEELQPVAFLRATRSQGWNTPRRP